MSGKKRVRHSPHRIVEKLQAADRLLRAGQSVGQVHQTLLYPTTAPSGYHTTMRARWIVTGLVLLAIMVAMAVVAPRKYPFRPTSAEHLWLWATTTPNPDAMQWWQLDTIRDGYVYYHIQQYHGWECYRVRIDAVESRLPHVIRELRANDASVYRGPWVLPAYEQWSAQDGNAIDLLVGLDEGRQQRILR